MESIGLPKEIALIRDGTFFSCNCLKNIILPENLLEIGSSAFKECSSLEKVEIPTGVDIIGYESFWGCKSVKEIKIPSSVTEIGDYAFEECNDIKIIGEKGSEAEKYAKKYNTKFEESTENLYKNIKNTFNGCKGSPVKLSITCREGDEFTFECMDNCGMQSKCTGYSSIIVGGFSSYSKTYELTFDSAGEHIISAYKNGNLMEYDKIIIAEEHTWDSGKVDKKETCMQDGRIKYTCTNCENTKTESIPATGHKYGNWKVTKKSTIFKNGEEKEICPLCKKTLQTRKINKLKASVKISKTKLSLKAGKTYKLKIKKQSKGDKVTKWTTSNKKIVSVNKKTGRIKALKKGKATITVKMKSGCKTSCRVTVE